MTFSALLLCSHPTTIAPHRIPSSRPAHCTAPHSTAPHPTPPHPTPPHPTPPHPTPLNPTQPQVRPGQAQPPHQAEARRPALRQPLSHRRGGRAGEDSSHHETLPLCRALLRGIRSLCTLFLLRDGSLLLLLPQPEARLCALWRRRASRCVRGNILPRLLARLGARGGIGVDGAGRRGRNLMVGRHVQTLRF